MVGRWLLWSGYVAVWTWALLVPDPGAIACALFGAGSGSNESQPEVQVQLLWILQSFYFSKIAHVIGYTGLAVLSAWLRLPGGFRWSMLGLLSIHALGTEFLQGFEPTRHPSWRDVGLDHLGIGQGLLLT
jgi:hypothetical protein